MEALVCINHAWSVQKSDFRKNEAKKMRYFKEKMENILCKFDDYEVKKLQNLHFSLFLFHTKHKIAR